MSNVRQLYERKSTPVHTIYAENLPQKVKDDIFHQAYYLYLLYGNGSLMLDDDSSQEAIKAMDDLDELMRQAERHAVIEHRVINVRHHPEIT
ncbi:hypothetical protein LQD23_16520 [Chromobacterium violaceum]|uniref:hypothetical protein n=1 Tax=Chromobacterium violaceum TaxID=536 RepID=UPI001E5E2147|nr:hypothetical protein [Chromobacterium violaceum]MCD0493887.1 hypothetical protein [Chromobacterium violaceum]